LAAPAPETRGGQPRRWAGGHLFQSAGFRFGAVYALLLGLSTAGLALFLWWATAGLLNRQTEAAINADAQGLSERWVDGGVPALVVTIDDRLAQNIDDDTIYLLTDVAKRRIAGNLAAFPPAVEIPGSWYELPVMRAGMRTLALVRLYDLPGGFHLLVGRDVRIRAQLRSLLTDALLWAMVVVAGMATMGALIVRSLFRRTLANISVVAAAISAGNFSQRVKPTGSGDEFDQLADTINDMLDRIARLMDGVRQVSNAIAHDLRTPITRARARLEEAAIHARSSEDLHAAIERATMDLDGIVGIFQALLRISEIEAGSRRSSFARFDLVPLLAEIEELYGAVAEDAGVQLLLTAPATVPLFGDKAMIQQAVANLVDNAVKFSPKGGSVTIEVSEGAMLLVAVSDMGPGIPATDRQRVTDRFFRGETARSTPGSGLGLSLVLAVAQLHGGDLRLDDNEPGVRAVLSFPLPEGRTPRPVSQDGTKM
jgi:signal transduction histidine kinase